ncbi:MAG TPA: HD domain-containing protein [Desulfatirhabdiaceae bacterium]|nr:HD domain-containing protein [Desulfatirhabdiaceae bacterium]
MNIDELNRLKNWFTTYVSDYYTGESDYDRNIRLKEEHTYHVCRNMTDLIDPLNLSENDRHLAEAIALFHDVGRFEQYRQYRTFFDRASENHARLGLKVLAEKKIMPSIERSERRILSRAIAFHNAAILPQNESSRTLLFMKLIRDADKLDIWRVVTAYYQEKNMFPNPTIELGLPDGPECSAEVIQAIWNNTFASIGHIRTLNDFKLLQISWVFDLNFKKSFTLLTERGYIDQIRSVLPQRPEVLRAVDHALDHVRQAASQSYDPLNGHNL